MFITLTVLLLIHTPSGLYSEVEKKPIYFKNENVLSFAAQKELYIKREQIYRIKNTNMVVYKNNEPYKICEIDLTDTFLGNDKTATYYWFGSCRSLIQRLNRK